METAAQAVSGLAHKFGCFFWVGLIILLKTIFKYSGGKKSTIILGGFLMENYIINKDSSVWSNLSNKFLKPEKTANGYLRVELQGKKYFIHRLVAEKYLSNPNNLPCINHKDENKENNNVSNLEWCSYQYNNNYGNRIAKAAAKKSKAVKQLTIDTEMISKNNRK